MGRREAHKLATRQALQEAADRLFAERGFEKTTVRDIVEAAGVTERTFFRYFAGKQELILDDALAWVDVLRELIVDRPAREDPVTAIRRAVLELIPSVQLSSRPSPLWLFSEGPPAEHVTDRAVAPAVLRVEQGLAEAIGERLRRSGQRYPMDVELLAQLTARTTFGLLRTVLLWRRKLEDEGRPRPEVPTLVIQAFSTLHIPVSPPR